MDFCHWLLGMNFNCGGKNLLAERSRALVIGQGLEEKFDCLTDIGKSLLDRLSLRLASFQLRTPSVTSLLVLFDYDTNLACHQSSFYRQRDRAMFQAKACREQRHFHVRAGS